MADEKRAPVQGYAPGIPWALHLEAYAAYCKKWSPQPALIDLDGRNCRGGFAVDELDEFVPGWRERADGVLVGVPRKPTNAEVAEWAERHDLRGSATDLRCAFEDAQTLHMADGVTVPPYQTFCKDTPP